MKKIAYLSLLLLSSILLFVSLAETRRTHAAFASADLSVSKVDSPDPVNAGSNLTYTITVSNNGPDAAANASWSDPPPAGTTFVTLPDVGGWSCIKPAPGDNGMISCSNPSFAVGSSVFTLTVAVAPTVPAGSTLSNTATATSSTPDGNPGNESGTATTTVLSPANVTGNKSVLGGTTPGSTVNYVIVLSNSSGSDQQDNPGNEFTDVLSPDLTLVSASANGGTAAANTGTNTVTWNGVVPANDSVTITIHATIKTGTEGHTIANQGTISYDADGNGTNEATASTNSVSFVVVAAPTSADVGVTKVTNSNTILADSDVPYTITVTNSGPDTTNNVALNDTLPGTMTFVSLTSPAGWSCTTPSVGAGGTVTCTRASLTVASGAQVFTLVGHIPLGTTDGTLFPNMATVSASTSDPNSGNNNANAGVTAVTCLTNPVVTTSADSGAGSLRRAIQDACVGGTITFDMTPGHVTSPITLTSGELAVDKNLTIRGPGANLLTVMRSTAGGTPNFRIFRVSANGPPSAATISGLTITNGHAPDGAPDLNGSDGGAIFNNGTSPLILRHVAIVANQAGDASTGGGGGGGGGIFNEGTVTLINSTVSGNRSGNGSDNPSFNGGFGGGIYNRSTMTIINCTISGNRTGDGGSTPGAPGGTGGGIASGTGLSVINSTITGNQTGNGVGSASSGGGGGIGSVGQVDIKNSIVANNTIGSWGSGPDLFGNVNSQDYNLFKDPSGASISGATLHNITGQDPNLGALSNNGGATQTHLPLPGSPAINAGNPANLPPDTYDLDNDADTAEPLPVDQRGFARVVGFNFDLGAVETNYAISATAGTPQSTLINTAFGTQLQATVTESGNPISGVTVTFDAPLSGASGTFPGDVTLAMVSTDGSGVATAPVFTANSTGGGPYGVVASIGSGLATVYFSLTNTGKTNQTIAFGPLSNKTFGDADFDVSATASSGLPVSFAASGNCTVTSPSPGTVHLTGAGSCTITASQPGDVSFNAAPNVAQSFSVAKADQTITFAAIPNKTFGDANFIVNPTASSGLPVSLSASGNCTVTTPAPGTVHTTGAGSCVITASQAGNANFNTAANVAQSFSIAKANQSITLAMIPDQTFGNPDFNVSATASSGLSVSLVATGNCTVTGTLIHLTAPGTCQIDASQSGNDNYNAAPVVTRTFSIAKTNQTISFGNLANKTFGDADFNVSATASSGLSVSFAALGNCTVSGSTVHLTGAGSCTITASQRGNATYSAAPNVSQTFSIAKANQTITFGALANKTFGDPDFNVSATASSGLSVSFSATGNCTISGNTVHLTGAGSCTITASQAGNANYNAAANVPQSFSIAKANQTITFNASANKTFGNADFNVSATASSGLSVSFTATGSCTVSGNTVHLTGAGSCTITASQTGNANFNAAANVPQTFSIAKANTTTALLSSLNPSSFGQSVTFTATVTSGGGTPSGTAQFKDNGTNLGAPMALNAGGVATFATSSLTAGTHTITADYSGDGNFLTSSGSLAGGQVVNNLSSLSINDVSTTEGNSGTKTLTFTVTLSSASNLTVNVNFATANGTATAPSDYVATNGTLTFNPGDLTKTIGVTINGDQTFEPDETFTVNLSNPVNTTISKATGTGTILNDDAQGGIISFSQGNYSVAESGGSITITVNRTGDTSGPATVDYTTPDDSSALTVLPCALPSGVALPRCDFTTAVGTLLFAPGETTKTFIVLISQDNFVEGPETLPLTLSNLTGGAVFGSFPTATLTITDDPVEPVTNPIDDTPNYVRQQYHDFFLREADAAGLAFWTNNIDNCTPKPACTDLQRINTSAAFFLSIEFQQSGYYVYRMYKAGFGDISPPTVPVPVRFRDFVRDTAEVDRGVVVGVGNWQDQLQSNKVLFAVRFVQRPDFLARYPNTMTATAFVNALDTNAGAVLTNAERTALIAELTPNPADTALRADVLMKTTENLLLQQREFNRAFVLMQYFGYLRRNPDAAPDLNFTGFNFWLAKLNQFNGNYVAAEMVKAFITSDEYRRHFGQ